MPDRNPAALDFLLARRSCPAKTLGPPGPDRAELTRLLTAAARSPDHGKLEPWRFVVLGAEACRGLADLVRHRGAALGRGEEEVAKMAAQFVGPPCAVAVILSPKASPKVPPEEQALSAGAVCAALLNAALASGWGANWLTGWAVYDEGFRREGLGLSDEERIAGLIHIGTASVAPPERPRPDLRRITTWRLA